MAANLTPANPAIGLEIAQSLEADKIGRLVAKDFLSTLNLATEEEAQAAACDECRKVRNNEETNPCPEDGAGPYCRTHQGRHIIRWHLGSELWEQHLEGTAKEFMAKRGLYLTGCHDEEKSHVLIRIEDKPASRTGRNHKRSIWYPMARRLGLNPGIVTTWRYPDANFGEQVAHLRKAVDGFCEASGLEPALWTNGSSGITLFMAPADKTAGARILPENPYEPAERQTSESGFTFNKTDKPGKIAKRLSVLRFGDGICLTDEPSFIHNNDPHIKLPDGSRLNVEIKDTKYVSNDLTLKRGAGDGNGAVRQSAARSLLRMAGITKKLSRIRKIQVFIMGGDFFMKGVFRIIPDDRFSGSPATDLIVDADSISNQVTDSRFTLIRLNRKDHKRQPGFVYIEPLLQADLAERLLGEKELHEAQAALMSQLHADDYKKAWRDNQAQNLEILQRLEEEEQENEAQSLDALQTLEEREESPHWETARDQENVHLDAALSTGFSDRMLRIACGSSGMFAVPTLAKILSGKIPSKLAAKERRAAPMAGIFASGAAVSLSAAPYSVPPEGKTRIPEPKPGYARLVWDHVFTDDLAEICISGQDAHRLDQALDTSDCDDDLTLVFVVKPNGDPGVLILKLPMSTEGGAVLRINRDDEKKLRSLGYRFHPLKGESIRPDLHDRREDGSPKFPNVLQPRQLPEDELPKWTADRDEAVESLAHLRRYRTEIGRATNMMAARYISRKDDAPMWDPEREKFEMSAAIVDPVENGDQDPTAITEALTELTYRAVRGGHPVDSCVSGRIGKSLRERHKAAEGDEAPPLSIPENCHHEDRKKALRVLVIEENRKLEFRMAVANGPIDRWQDEPFPKELATLAGNAMQARDQAWNKANSEARAFRRETSEWTRSDGQVVQWPVHTRQEAKTREALLKSGARAAEEKAVDLAYAEAKALDGYRPGQFHAMWTKLWLYRKDGETLSMYSLARLPDEEHQSYYGSGFSQPLAALKLNQGQKWEGIKPGDVFRLKAAKSGKETRFHLHDPESGKPVFRVKATKAAKAAAPAGKHRTLTVRHVLTDPEGQEGKAPLLILSPDMEPR